MKVEAYCVKCKASREMKDPALVSMKNGRCAARGACPSCTGVLYKILSRECSEKLARAQAEPNPS